MLGFYFLYYSTFAPAKIPHPHTLGFVTAIEPKNESETTEEGPSTVS